MPAPKEFNTKLLKKWLSSNPAALNEFMQKYPQVYYDTSEEYNSRFNMFNRSSSSMSPINQFIPDWLVLFNADAKHMQWAYEHDKNAQAYLNNRSNWWNMWSHMAFNQTKNLWDLLDCTQDTSIKAIQSGPQATLSIPSTVHQIPIADHVLSYVSRWNDRYGLFGALLYADLIGDREVNIEKPQWGAAIVQAKPQDILACCLYLQANPANGLLQMRNEKIIQSMLNINARRNPDIAGFYERHRPLVEVLVNDQSEVTENITLIEHLASIQEEPSLEIPNDFHF